MSVVTRSWRSLGTSVHVLVTDAALADTAQTAVAAVLERVDATYSRFRRDSEISRVNARPGETSIISPLLATALEAGLRSARLTDGASDPTIGRSLRAVGYDGDFDGISQSAGPIVLRVEPAPGWRRIRFDPDVPSVHIPHGIEIDLGSSGKALAADLAAAAAHRAMGRGGVLVSLGGDIATAGTAPDGGWLVLAAEDSATADDADGEVIALASGAIATSSTTVRQWVRGDVRLHHIIDPATGLPAVSPWRTVSVVAADCVDANAASTAAIVRGDGAIAWLFGLGLPARLVATNGEIHRVGAWPIPAGVAA